MQAIMTVYHGATGSRGSRIKATASQGQSISIPYDSALSDYDANEKAAYALCRKLGWTGRLIGGGWKNNYVWVFAASADFAKGGARDARRARSRATARRRLVRRTRRSY